MKIKKVGKSEYYFAHGDIKLEISVQDDSPFGSSVLKAQPVYKFVWARLTVGDGTFKPGDIRPTDHYCWGRSRLLDDNIFEFCEIIYKKCVKKRWVRPDKTERDVAKQGLLACLGSYVYHLRRGAQPKLAADFHSIINHYKEKT